MRGSACILGQALDGFESFRTTTIIIMKTYVILITFTAQGVQAVQDSPKRAVAFTQFLESSGIKTKGIYWTFGNYDGILLLEAPDEQSMHSAILTLTHAGNVKTETLRAYDAGEMEPLLAKIIP